MTLTHTSWKPDLSRPFVNFGRASQVGGGGTLFLALADTVASSTAGIVVPRNCFITASSLNVDVIDASRTFNLEIVSAPSGAATTIASLNLPLSTRSVTTKSLAVFVSSGTEIGARVVRATGAGASTFNNIQVIVEFTQGA